MWPWQRNGEQPNILLIRRLLALSSLGHVFLLAFLFVFYHDDVTSVSRDVIAVLLDTNVTVVRVPLSKVVNKKVPLVGSGTKATACVKKEAPPATGLAKPKVQPKIEAAKKETAKAKAQAKQKKETPKPKEPEIKKVVKEEPKKIETKQEILKPVIEEKTAAKLDDQIVDQQIEHGDNVVYVGQHEYAALEVQRQIQQEAQRCWKAPSGMPADAGCQIVVQIDHTGKIRTITLAEPSGILMYDVQARQAVSHMEFPRGAWGKEVVVYFKQS